MTYRNTIIEATGCTNDDAAEIEDIMRHTIFHSTLDWQTRGQLIEGAREAQEVLHLLRREG